MGRRVFESGGFETFREDLGVCTAAIVGRDQADAYDVFDAGAVMD